MDNIFTVIYGRRRQFMPVLAEHIVALNHKLSPATKILLIMLCHNTLLYSYRSQELFLLFKHK